MLSVLNDEGVEYLVVGAYALAAHGVPRATGDLDFWIRRDENNARHLLRALEKFGAPTEGLAEADFLRDDLVVQIGREPSRIDFLTSLDGLSFQDAWDSKVRIEVDGIRVFVLSRDDLIRNKKAVGRTRDLADVEQLESTEPET